MTTTPPLSYANKARNRETHPSRRSLQKARTMSLRPPSFRIILALVGASLVLWGAKGVVLNIPGLLEFNLFEMNRAAAWALVSATVGVLLLAWLRPAMFAWMAWCVALGSLAFLLNDLNGKIQALGAGFAEMSANGMPAPDLNKMIRSTQIRPGAVAIGAGLVIQAVGLCLRHRT